MVVSSRNRELPTFDSAMSLVNSKVPEQRERGMSFLERGEFREPDSAKVWPLSCLCPFCGCTCARP
jgi:hypothetical protein